MRRIFKEWIEGRSRLEIAAGLNRDGIPGPNGKPWGSSTIIGNAARGTGIINNRLYLGELVWNRLKYTKHPVTGRRQSRLNPKSEWVTQQVPELAIVDTATWESAQRVRRVTASQPVRDRRRPRRLLSGLLACGSCGRSYIIAQGEWCACSAYKAKRTCNQSRMIKMSEVEQRVLDALKTRLLEPDAVAAFVESYRAERDRLAKAHARDRRAIEREIAATDRKLGHIMTAIEDGEGELKPLLQRQKALSAEKRELERKLPLIETPVVTLHPQAHQRYRRQLDELQAILATGDEAADEAMRLVRSLVTRIVVIPERNRMGLKVIWRC